MTSCCFIGLLLRWFDFVDIDFRCWLFVFGACCSLCVVCCFRFWSFGVLVFVVLLLVCCLFIGLCLLFVVVYCWLMLLFVDCRVLFDV